MRLGRTECWLLPSTLPGLVQLGPGNYVAGQNRLAGVAHDAAGNQIQFPEATGRTARFDAENRMVEVGGVGQNAQYFYDGEGRRVKKVVGAVTTAFVYGADGELMADYVYGGGTADAGTKYLIEDHLGSTRVVTDGAGNCVGRVDYLPFGAAIPRTGPCYGADGGVRQHFTGQERDQETSPGTGSDTPGRDFFQLRYYAGNQGRFVSPDAPGADQGLGDALSWNLYSYVRNNPLRYTDPSGGRCEVKITSARQSVSGDSDDTSEGRVTAACGHSVTVSGVSEFLDSFESHIARISEKATLARQYLEVAWTNFRHDKNCANTITGVVAGGSAAVGGTVGYGGGFAVGTVGGAAGGTLVAPGPGTVAGGIGGGFAGGGLGATGGAAAGLAVGTLGGKAISNIVCATGGRDGGGGDGSGGGGDGSGEGGKIKELTPGEIRKLKAGGEDAEKIKKEIVGPHGARYNLFKTSSGDIVVKAKNGAGEAQPTGLNINNF